MISKEFSDRFQDFKSQEVNLHIFYSPFDIDVAQTPNELQMELIELQCDEELKQKLGNSTLLEFYRTLPKDRFLGIVDFERKKMSLFRSTYVCEQLFSKMKYTKSKTRSSLTDCHLENNLRVATTTISANIDFLVNNIQPQKSH